MTLLSVGSRLNPFSDRGGGGVRDQERGNLPTPLFVAHALIQAANIHREGGDHGSRISASNSGDGALANRADMHVAAIDVPAIGAFVIASAGEGGHAP